MKRKNSDIDHGMKLRSGKYLKKLANVKSLPSDILQEINSFITKFKDIISSNNKFEQDFGSKIIELILVIGKDKGIYIQDVNQLINNQYPLQKDQILFTESEVQERSNLYDIIYDLTHFIVGDHKKLLIKKEHILRKNIEKAIISSFYGEDIIQEKREEIQNILFNHQDNTSFESDDTDLLGSNIVPE